MITRCCEVTVDFYGTPIGTMLTTYDDHVKFYDYVLRIPVNVLQVFVCMMKMWSFSINYISSKLIRKRILRHHNTSLQYGVFHNLLDKLRHMWLQLTIMTEKETLDDLKPILGVIMNYNYPALRYQSDIACSISLFL